MKIEILYFAWVRERIGCSKEIIETDARTVSELIDDLTARDESYKWAFQDTSLLRVAINQELSDITSSLKDASEVAFFPPMTGG